MLESRESGTVSLSAGKLAALLGWLKTKIKDACERDGKAIREK